jgi:hypothetical protein
MHSLGMPSKQSMRCWQLSSSCNIRVKCMPCRLTHVGLLESRGISSGGGQRTLPYLLSPFLTFPSTDSTLRSVSVFIMADGEVSRSFSSTCFNVHAFFLNRRPIGPALYIKPHKVTTRTTTQQRKKKTGDTSSKYKHWWWKLKPTQQKTRRSRARLGTPQTTQAPKTLAKHRRLRPKLQAPRRNSAELLPTEEVHTAASRRPLPPWD